MSNDKYRLILTGYQEGKGEYYIEMDIAEAFGITPEEAKALFAKLPNTLKEGLTEEQAEKHKATMEKAGGKCEVESMRYSFDGLSID